MSAVPPRLRHDCGTSECPPCYCSTDDNNATCSKKSLPQLGLLNDDLLPVENALQEFLAMFQGLLPHYVVAALTAAFNLDDDGAEELDEALAAVAGDAIDDLQDEAANLQVLAQAAAV